jgi:hypothetical protein
MQGDLGVLVRSFAQAMPGRDSHSYRPPREPERRSMELAFRAVLRGDLSGAVGAAADASYEVFPFTDRATGRDLVLLAEARVGEGPPGPGWGLFVHAMDAGSEATIEVPHPVFDAHTEAIGVDTFRRCDASNLFIAGTHRHANPFGAADVAHQPLSVFETLHLVAIEGAGVVFQPHGFESRGARRSWDAVVSCGALPPDELVWSVARRLPRLGLHAVPYDGEACRVLGGTHNVQGRSTRAHGGRFLHLELAHSVRSDPRAAAEVAAEVAEAIESFLTDPVA